VHNRPRGFPYDKLKIHLSHDIILSCEELFQNPFTKSLLLRCCISASMSEDDIKRVSMEYLIKELKATTSDRSKRI
jgi:hypothetical protein